MVQIKDVNISILKIIVFIKNINHNIKTKQCITNLKNKFLHKYNYTIILVKYILINKKTN